ncbi:MAG: glycosyltransferase [Clostridiales bacterium]|nr:glycosyltransferase [Clostridiales bacterium]
MSTGISVIMPFYNAEKFLNEAVSSVLSQTMDNIELILVDDGSSDTSCDIVDAFSKNDDRIKIIHQQNSGVSSARNAALKIARGKYIGFVDADDFIMPEMYEALYDIAEKNGADIVCSGFDYISSDGKEIIDTSCPPYKDGVIYGREEIKKFASEMHTLSSFLYIWRSIFSRELIEKNGISFNEDLSIGEDTLFAMNCFLSADKVVGCEKRFYRYRINNDSAMRRKYKPDFASNLILQYNEKMKLCESYFPELKDVYIKDAAEYTLKNLWCGLFSNIYNNDLKLKQRIHRLKEISGSVMFRDAFLNYDIDILKSRSVDWFALKLLKSKRIFLADLSTELIYLIHRIKHGK